MTLLNKCDIIAHGLSEAERRLEKGTKTSRTKNEIRTAAEDAVKVMSRTRLMVAKPRNMFDEITPGEEGNSLYDELSVIGEEIGTAQYMLANGNVNEASEILGKISIRIRGYV